jgi:hypothetical protein
MKMRTGGLRFATVGLATIRNNDSFAARRPKYQKKKTWKILKLSNYNT